MLLEQDIGRGRDRAMEGSTLVCRARAGGTAEIVAVMTPWRDD